ncbi:unnamed protein product [Urochloa humidicola]
MLRRPRYPDYPYPAGFDPGQGDVLEINKAIKEEFSVLGKLVEEFQEGDRQYRRSMGWLPPLMGPHLPDPEPCYSIAQCERAMKRMTHRREWVLDSIGRVLEMGGNPFLFPPGLAAGVSAAIGQPRPRPYRTVQLSPPIHGQPAPRLQ